MQYEPAYYIGKYRRYIIMGVILLVLLITGATIWYNLQLAEQRRGKLAVPVDVVPNDANVVLSTGQQLPSRGTAYISPGNYNVTVSKQGFASQTRPLRVTQDAVPYIYIGLVGTTQEAKNWVDTHPEEYQRLQSLTVVKNQAYNTLFKSNNTIVNILPIKDPYYSVDYRNYNDESIELVIWGTSPATRQAALDQIRAKGYDPTDYRISYDGFDNPLGGQR